ncbi:MAG: glutamate--tRNA ligase [Patescibacteria group bacterium]|nr:glutamate--tRNA ligase [Patescibacteria group bacterium]
MKKTVKTRFAPSPTGDLHIGSLRTALFEYLFAKHNGGEFLLRIEDTDQTRYKEGSTEVIFEGLKWAGLDYDNKDNIIFQSKRTEIYQKFAAQLVEQDDAYYCFCSAERLEKMREEQIARKVAPKYDRHCLNLSKEEIGEKLKAGEPHVIRMKISEHISPPFEGGVSRRDKGVVNETNNHPAPIVVGAPLLRKEGIITFHDLIRGQVSFNLKEIDDQILIKSDGFPTYHLANVIDDHESEITHVIRAEDWLSSTPKHLILYKALGWDAPEFGHLSLILAPDKSKLSKRHGATSVLEFKKLGYLPEALINYIALLGWNPGTEQEIFSLKDLEKEFSLEKVQKAGAIFDINKLDWMNGEYIKKMDLDKLVDLCLPFLKACPERSPEYSGRVEGPRGTWEDKKYLKKIISLEQPRLNKLSDIAEATAYFFTEPQYEKELLKWRKADLKDAKEKLEFLIEKLSEIPNEDWNKNNLEAFIKELISIGKLETGNVLWPLRVALTGREKSPSPFEVAEVLGKEESLGRIKKAVEKI